MADVSVTAASVVKTATTIMASRLLKRARELRRGSAHVASPRVRMPGQHQNSDMEAKRRGRGAEENGNVLIGGNT